MSPISRVRLPRRRWWRRALAARYGADSPKLVRAISVEYATLIADQPPWVEENRALHFHVRQAIIPNLAAYRVLSREHADPVAARSEVLHLMAAQLRPVLRVVSVLDLLAVPFGRVRRATRWLVQHAFPAAGFTIGWPPDDDDALQFDVTACVYLRVLRHYGAPELTAVFCHGDQLVYDQMPRTVRFTRTGTLATGAPRCDFLLQPADRQRQ